MRTTLAVMLLSATLGAGCAVNAAGDEDDLEAFDDEGDEREAEAVGRPNNTGGISAQPLPKGVGSMRGFSRHSSGYMSVLDVWKVQFPTKPIPGSGYVDVRGCAERLCAVHFVFTVGKSRYPVDLLMSKSEMGAHSLATTRMALDSRAYRLRTDAGNFRSSDARVGDAVRVVDVTVRPPAGVLYKPGVSSARANNYVVSGGLLAMMDANNGGSGAGYSATPIYNGMHVRTTGRTFQRSVGGNDILYAEVVFNLENLAGPRDQIYTWVVHSWSASGKWSAPTLR
jgi:hypothetical protein